MSIWINIVLLAIGFGLAFYGYLFVSLLIAAGALSSIRIVQPGQWWVSVSGEKVLSPGYYFLPPFLFSGHFYSTDTRYITSDIDLLLRIGAHIKVSFSCITDPDIKNAKYLGNRDDQTMLAASVSNLSNWAAHLTAEECQTILSAHETIRALLMGTDLTHFGRKVSRADVISIVPTDAHSHKVLDSLSQTSKPTKSLLEEIKNRARTAASTLAGLKSFRKELMDEYRELREIDSDFATDIKNILEHEEERLKSRGED